RSCAWVTPWRGAGPAPVPSPPTRTDTGRIDTDAPPDTFFSRDRLHYLLRWSLLQSPRARRAAGAATVARAPLRMGGSPPSGPGPRRLRAAADGRRAARRRVHRRARGHLGDLALPSGRRPRLGVAPARRLRMGPPAGPAELGTAGVCRGPW